MKKLLIPIILFLGVLTVLADEKEQQFKKAYFEAIADSDEAMFRLIEFSDQVPEIFNELLKESLREDRRRTITTVKFRNPTEEAMTEFTHEGVVYVPALEIEKEFVVTYEETDEQAQITETVYSLGTKNGAYKIVGPKPKL